MTFAMNLWKHFIEAFVSTEKGHTVIEFFCKKSSLQKCIKIPTKIGKILQVTILSA